VLVELLAHHPVYPIIDRYLPHTLTLTVLLHIVTFVHFSVQVLRYFIALFSGMLWVRTRGNGVSIPIFVVETRSHTFLH